MPISRKQFLKILGLGALPATFLKGSGLAQQTLEKAKATTKRLKITEVEIYYLDIKLVEPFTVSLGTITSANNVFIRLITDAGIIGVGEASPVYVITGETQATNIEVAKSLREAFKGLDPFNIERANKLIGPFLHSNPSVVAAFDIALYDILGKVAGLPIYRLLGGDKSTFETDVTVGIDTPEKMAKSAKENIAAGFKCLKVKIGQDPDQDLERLQAIREAIGHNYPVRVDANQGYTPAQAIYVCRQMEKLKIQLCEQPVLASDIDGLRRVRAESPIPIMADESLFTPAEAIKLIKAEACDFFNIKIMKAGGITNSLHIATIAEAANIRCMVGCMIETRLALTAAAHVCGAKRNIVFADLDAYFSLVTDPVIGGMTVKNGLITLPEEPGLGADLDPAFLKTLKKA